MRWQERFGIGARIGLVAMAVAVLAIGIVAVGVTVFGGDLFMDVMTSHGETADSAWEMFETTVLGVLVLAIVVSMLAATLLAVVAARWLARPLRDLGAAARRIARGDYGTRIVRRGPDELASLADSFNQMSASLEAQERMRREFVANAAHELRTPLTNLQGYLEALRDGVITPSRETYDSLLEEADRLVRLSRSLDTLADAATPVAELVEVDVARAIRNAVELHRPAAASRSLELRSELPDRLAGRADADQLAQVLANLLQNALRYAPEGGTITVRGEHRAADVLVTVANTGTEIDPAELPRLYERFYRIDPSRDRRSGGAGIGLAIVKQLVEMWGGRVGAESRDGQTRFWFSLPSA